MTDGFGRVDPVSPHFPHREAREGPYRGRHPKKHHGENGLDQDPDTDLIATDETESGPAGKHIDLRI